MKLLLGVSIINRDPEEKRGSRLFGLLGRDQALEFLKRREPRLSNFLGLYCNITIK